MMSPYLDKEKQKAYMRDYQRRQREELKQLRKKVKKEPT
jgi:hypothetical protein